MNSTITRFALAVPATAAIFGWSLTAAEAAPYEPSDHIKIQPAENTWPDDIVMADPDDVDEPDDPPADEPTEEPADEDSDEEADEEWDEDASDEEPSDNGQSAPVQKSDDDGKSSNGETDSSDAGTDADADVVETASSTDLAPSFGPAGVRVPLLMVIGAGALVTGVAGWAGYRRSRLLAH